MAPLKPPSTDAMASTARGSSPRARAICAIKAARWFTETSFLPEAGELLLLRRVLLRVLVRRTRRADLLERDAQEVGDSRLLVLAVELLVLARGRQLLWRGDRRADDLGLREALEDVHEHRARDAAVGLDRGAREQALAAHRLDGPGDQRVELAEE